MILFVIKEKTMSEILGNSTLVMQLLTSALLAILFIQSGLDKVFDWKNNLDWLQGQFKETPLKGIVSPMLAIVTVIEVAAGAMCLFGVLMLLFRADPYWSYLGSILAGLNIVMLFFGQRMSKEYAGAASLIPYFLLTLASIFIMS
ncbi:MAG: hypothetical protein ACJAZ3_000694 [Sphingobacteriales bacterium]|jgi:hypothetical protein